VNGILNSSWEGEDMLLSGAPWARGKAALYAECKVYNDDDVYLIVHNPMAVDRKKF
jgi:hypothetical protein